MKYKVKLVGKTPYMQHKMNDEDLETWEKKRGRIIERAEVHEPDEKRALYHMYIDDDGIPFIPAEQLLGAFINAGGFIKSKVGNSKKSMKNIVAAMFSIIPDKITLTAEWKVDKRSAVNKNIKARVIVIRPRWDEWETEFILEVDNDTITKQMVNTIIEYAGQYVGIGSFRPTNNGPFGRFMLTELKEV